MVKLISMLCLLLVIVGAGFLWIELNQPIRTVRVAGALSAAEQGEIRTAMGASLAQGLLAVDLASVQADIRRLSWPRKVTVRRLWPAGLEIRVEKDLAVASWGDGGYLTSDGRVMQFPEAPSGLPSSGLPSTGLPGFRCARSRPREAMEVYGLLNQAVAATGLTIAMLIESELGDWEVVLDNGIRVVLGRHELAERLGRFRLAFERGLHDRFETVDYVDARYASGIAVRWKETLVAFDERTPYGI